MTEHEPTCGSEEWFERRERLWAASANRLLDELETYEDEHPKGAPCLVKAMDAAGASVVEWENRHEPLPPPPNPGIYECCGRSGERLHGFGRCWGPRFRRGAS